MYDNSPPPPPPPSDYPQQSMYRSPVLERVPNYLVQSILVTLFCCQPLGIVGIVFAAQVDGKLASGDYAGAVETSNQAKKWTTIGFAIGLGIDILVLIFYGIAIIAAISSNSSGY